MCDFFSVTSDGKGDIKYFDWELRQKCLNGELNYEPDSHTSINDYFGYKGADEDCRNKFEFNPLTGGFKIDALNTFDDSKDVAAKVRGLDFSKIVPQLVIKPIVFPFDIEPPVVGYDEIELLREWVSVWDSVMDSVLDSVGVSVWDSVMDSVLDSVGDSVLDSVWDSVGDSVRASVLDSVLDSVWDSVRDSVWDSVGAYTSSFFDIAKWKHIEHESGVNPFQPCIDLWGKGLVPSFDGAVWRLHGGKKADVLYDVSAVDLMGSK